MRSAVEKLHTELTFFQRKVWPQRNTRARESSAGARGYDFQMIPAVMVMLNANSFSQIGVIECMSPRYAGNLLGDGLGSPDKRKKAALKLKFHQNNKQPLSIRDQNEADGRSH